MRNKKELYKKAVEYWGIEAQHNQLIQECSELIIAVTKLSQYKNSPTMYNKYLNNLKEEIADVEIMLEQMREFYDNVKIGIYKEEKLKRLKHMLDKYKTFDLNGWIYYKK